VLIDERILLDMDIARRYPSEIKLINIIFFFMRYFKILNC